jgi:maltose O-acetyltransferase
MKTEKDKMLSGELYFGADPQLTRERERARSLTRQFNATTETEYGSRTDLLKELFGTTGESPRRASTFTRRRTR